LLIKFTGLIT